jgi:transposase
MAIVTVYVGLDYHQDSIRVAILNEEGKELFNRDCPNDVEVVCETILKYGQVAHCAIEACCGAADFAEEVERRYPFTMKLAHPGYVRKLKQSPDKTDYADAFLLGDLIRVNYLPEVWLPPGPTRELRRLTRYRQQLRQDKTLIKQRLLGLARDERLQGPPARRWTKDWMAWIKQHPDLGQHARWVLQRHLARLESLQKEISAVEAELEKAIADDALAQKLLSLPGIGLVTAAVLRAEIGRFQRFHTGKQLARFCGVTPCNASSGRRQADAGLIRAANRELRTIVLEAAHRLGRQEGPWRELNQRLRRQKKSGSVVAAAVANRWIRWLYHQMVRVETAPPESEPTTPPLATPQPVASVPA